MWTPRRILLLFATLFGFGAAYTAYARFLGRIDGLPNLPAKYLEIDPNALPEVAPVESPTLVRLREAFGDNCPEMGAAYPTRLEIREQGIVFAAGMPQIGTEPTRFVKLAPLSIATFAKPKPLHEQVPGEVAEVSTLHCDEGILEFDRPIASDRDMLTGKAKLIGIELRTNPDLHNTDPRNGRIVISNNQRTNDPGRFFVMKTPGPVYYLTADHPEANKPSQPHIWTTANVEIVNRDNLPRPLRGVALPVVPVPADDSLTGSTVTDMALGLHTSPPTVTADGLKIFMKRNEASKKSGFGGIREMILSENVLFSLWVDGNSGFPGSQPQAPTKTMKVEPTLALPGLVGGLHDGVATAARLKSKVLLRVRTLGAFRYDMATNLAAFEVALQPHPVLPNNVEVMRFLPAGGKDTLICQKLDIEFNGPVTGTAKSEGPGFKRMHASGTHVLIAAATEQLQAAGTALTYENDTANKRTTTTLFGAPLSAVRNRNILIAGTPALPSKLTFSSSEKSQMDIAIIGPGRAELYDEATSEKTLTATWQKSLAQIRETIDGVPLDLLVFTGDGEFIDAKGAFNLKGDVLKLWLKAGDKTASKSVPHRLQGLGHVSGLSADSIIENTDYLNVMFVDVAKPPASALPPTIAVIPSGPTPIIQPVVRAQVIKKDPHPIRMSARLIDVTVHRLNDVDPKVAAKYDMHEAHCTDRVVVVQPPEDPKKSAIGIDIRGGSLLMKKQGLGHIMTVSGTNMDIARVRFENTTISGPLVTIDQPNNSVAVTGGGWMKMPSSSNLAGAAVDEKGEITIHWQDKMSFYGERRLAMFIGQVQAVQSLAEGVVTKASATTKSTVACHQLDVTFDKPIYFNQMTRDAKNNEGDPKVKTVACTPASGDEAAKAANLVLYLEETIDRVTKKTTKATQIEAKSLDVTVEESMSRIRATGPGTTRLLQLDARDSTPGAPPPPANAKPEMEMKLTVVRFNGQLDLADQKGIFQKAIFKETIRVARVPTDNLNLAIDDVSQKLPRSMYLKCNESFTVSSYRSRTPGGEDMKSMEAVDGAEVKTDDYIGIGHTIKFDGEKVELRGYKDGQATLYRQPSSITGRDYKSGNPLIYNTKTGQVSGAESSGGAFTTDK